MGRLKELCLLRARLNQAPAMEGQLEAIKLLKAWAQSISPP